MSLCIIEGCGAEITFCWNPATEKRCPLVPFEEKYPKAVRYNFDINDAFETLAKQHECEHCCVRADEGAWMLHYANCKDPGAFGKRSRG